MNFVDLFLGRGSFGVSAADVREDVDITSYSANVKNLKAYGEAGDGIAVEYDSATGEARFSAIPSKITYDYDTGFEDVMMDVEVYPSELQDETETLSGIDQRIEAVLLAGRLEAYLDSKIV